MYFFAYGSPNVSVFCTLLTLPMWSTVISVTVAEKKTGLSHGGRCRVDACRTIHLLSNGHRGGRRVDACVDCG